jgi:hypothetical protein
MLILRLEHILNLLNRSFADICIYKNVTVNMYTQLTVLCQAIMIDSSEMKMVVTEFGYEIENGSLSHATVRPRVGWLVLMGQTGCCLRDIFTEPDISTENLH